MLPTIFALFLLWVLYLWLDRQRLTRLLKPNQPTPAYQPPPKLEFDNLQRVAEINRARRRAKWVTPDLPPTDRKARPSQPPSKPQFINSKTNAEISQEEQQAKQMLPDPTPPVSPIAPKKPEERELAPSPEKSASTPKPIPHRQVRVTTCNHLLRLVGHDFQMAQRLVEHTRQKNPDKAEQWCWEKVIWDLERDRR